jgi:predicted dehydrogenase
MARSINQSVVREAVNVTTTVVGLGRIAPLWLPTLLARPDVVLRGAIDRAGCAAQRAAELGLTCRVATDLGALEPGGLVVNLTPTHAHRNVIEAAFAAGSDVFTEKPLVADLGDAIALVELAERASRRLLVMQNRRATAGARALRDIVESDVIGAASSFRNEVTLGVEPTGVLERNDRPLLREMGIHSLDLGRYLAGVHATAVLAHEFTPAGSLFAGPPAATCIVELADGAELTFHGNWAAPGGRTTWNGRWRISGSRADAVWDGAGDLRVEGPQGDFRPHHLDGGDPSGHARAIGEGLDALLAGRQPPVDGREHLRSLALVAAALRSGTERRWATIEEVVADARAGRPVPCA